MKVTRHLLLTLLLAGAFSTVEAKKGATAPKTPPPKKEDKVEAYLKQHDKNKDGVIDKSEFAGSDFAKWDKNNDGKLDKGELGTMLNPPKKGK